MTGQPTPIDPTREPAPFRSSRRSVLKLGLAGIGTAVVAAACGSNNDDAAATPAPSTATTAAAGNTATATSTATVGSPATAAATATTTAASGATALTAADFAELEACILTPEQTEGPYYLNADLMRRDITEGHNGLPLRLGLLVQDTACQPIEGALVDAWHADIDGDYSAYIDGMEDDDDGGPGSTFLRGTQLTNADGIVEFDTIYPGWYTGRAVHIHLKVHIESRTVLTSQLFFDDAVTDAVYEAAPYNAHGTRNTRNANDSIFNANGNQLALVKDEAGSRGAGKLALLILGVDPAATSTAGRGGGPGGNFPR